LKRPTFFLSSTILDFKDLRSALKFHLEEKGCRVLASEFNDFTKPVDKHSYDACLNAIHTTDYFVLLIGNRVGGWYDEASRISITQREYREAYEIHKMGKLKLLNFVRSDVWQIKEDRRELAKYLESLSLDDTTKKNIVNFPSKFASDAEFLSSFITEVGRNQETKLAVKGTAIAPTGNWINIFSGFRDIIDVIDTNLFLSTPVEDQTQKRLLRHELREFLTQCLLKFQNGKVCSPLPFIEKFYKEHPISLGDRKSEFILVATENWDILSSLSIQLLGLHLHPDVLSRAISLPTFIDFDLDTEAYKETQAYLALLRLQSEIRNLTRDNNSENLSIIFEHSKKNQPLRGEYLQIGTVTLIAFLHLLDRWANVIELSRSILLHLDGEPFQMPILRPDSPVQGMQQMLDQDKPNEKDLDDFIIQRSIRRL
jgi:hypothetical protein